MERPSPDEMQLLLAWISNVHATNAWDHMNQIVETKPELAWDVIQEMVRLAPGDKMLFSVAAGPLEDLLHRHPGFTRKAAALARQDLRWHKCLSGVWGLDGAAANVVERALAAPPPSEVPVSGSVSRKRARLIAAWFHHSETMWAPSQLNDVIRTDPEKAWRLMLLLVRIASEPRDDDVLEAICTFVFSTLVERHPANITEKVVSECEQNAVIRSWVDQRRSYCQIGREWEDILRRVPITHRDQQTVNPQT